MFAFIDMLDVSIILMSFLFMSIASSIAIDFILPNQYSRRRFQRTNWLEPLLAICLMRALIAGTLTVPLLGVYAFDIFLVAFSMFFAADICTRPKNKLNVFRPAYAKLIGIRLVTYVLVHFVTALLIMSHLNAS